MGVKPAQNLQPKIRPGYVLTCAGVQVRGEADAVSLWTLFRYVTGAVLEQQQQQQQQQQREARLSTMPSLRRKMAQETVAVGKYSADELMAFLRKPLDMPREYVRCESHPLLRPHPLLLLSVHCSVDKLHPEASLLDSDFERVLGMTRTEFNDLPAWKQLQVRKSSGLF